MRNKPSKKKTFFGFILGFFEHENIELIILGVASLFVSIFGHAIYTNHSQIQAQFDALVNSTRDISDANEYIYDDCKVGDMEQVRQDIDTLRDKQKTFIDQQTSMGKLLTLKTYCAVHELSYASDQLQKAGIDVCKLPLMSEQEIYPWRDSIVKQIRINQMARQNFWSSIKEYFSNERLENYDSSECPPSSHNNQ